MANHILPARDAHWPSPLELLTSQARRALGKLMFQPPSASVEESTMRLANVTAPRSLDRGHVALIGTTGSGKSTALEILAQSILAHPPAELDVFNAVVADPQNDFFRPLMSMALPMPVVLSNVFDRRAWAWDMARDITDPVSAEQFAYDLIPDEKNTSENKYFTEAPRILFASILRELTNRHLDDPSFHWTLRQAILLTLHAVYARCFIAQSSDEVVRFALPILSDDQGPTRANVQSSLVTKLRKVATIAAMLEQPTQTFSLDEIIRGFVVLVVGGDHQFKEVLNPFNRLLLTVLKNKLVGQEKSESRRHYLFIDEFAAVNGDKSADEVLDFFVRGRSRGVRLAIAIHTPQQLKALYGAEMTDVILGQTQHKLIFKVNDYEGAASCSRELGQVYGHEWTHSVNVSHTYSFHNSTSHSLGASEQRVDYPVVHWDQIKSLPLASFTHGIRGFGVISGDSAVNRWRFQLTPAWLARHMVALDPSIESYEACRRRRPEEQRLTRLSQQEVERFGLVYVPEAHWQPTDLEDHS